MVNHTILSDPKEICKEMIEDIRKAKKEIFLETYSYGDDEIGRSVREELTKKANEGIKIRLLIDGWGTRVKKGFFKRLVEAGGRVRFFKELQYFFKTPQGNNERNHRKLLIIDNKISYIGSMNITAEFINGEELVLRIDNELTNTFHYSFRKIWNLFNNWKSIRMDKIFHRDFELIQDTPHGVHRPTEKTYKNLIKSAKKEISIMTPYFIPPFPIRKALRKAAKKGVKINIILPQYSDFKSLDILKDKYLGRLYRSGINIHYLPKFIHSKLLIIDSKYFMIGSSNLDYRSFLHQYEINLVGKNKKIISGLKEHFQKRVTASSPFDYKIWTNRNSFRKTVEWLLGPHRKYL